MTRDYAVREGGMVILTDAAAKKMREILAADGVSPEAGGMRFGVESGGCAGFRYFFKSSSSRETGDAVFEHGGVRLFVDAESMKFVDGSDIDWGYVPHLLGEGFKVNNPNTDGSCGCGVSVRFT